MYSLKSLFALENEDHKMLWDFSVRTDHDIEARRPGFINHGRWQTKIGPDPARLGWTRPDPIGSDRIDKTRTRSITPDNVLEFCVFVSCEVVSSFIESRQNVFFSKGDYRF